MKIKLLALSLLLAVMSVMVLSPFNSQEALASNPDGLLKNVPVEGMVVEGGTFAGTMTITQIALNDAGTGLLAWGELKGHVTGVDGKKTHIKHDFEGEPFLLSLPDGTAPDLLQQEVCQILFLDLGPIFIDLLGLTIDLSPVTLDISAVQGEGNLLGNLLCAIVNLLNP